jgi:hypothetical protein
MAIVQRNWLIRILFVFVALVLVLAFAAVAQAEDAPVVGKPGCIHGMAWFDANRNGIKDSNEDVMDGASVVLLAAETPFRYRTGPYWLITRQITRDGGMYEFCGLDKSVYEVRIVPPAGVISDDLFISAGSNPAGPIALEQGGEAVIIFGFGFPHVLDSDDTLNHP